MLLLKTRAVHGQFWAVLRSLCKVGLSAWRGINSPHISDYIWSCKCFIHITVSCLCSSWNNCCCCITTGFHTFVCTLHCQRKKGGIPLIQLFKKDQSHSGGTQLETLTFTSWFLLHFNWETAWVLFAILFLHKSDKLEWGGELLHLLEVKFVDSSAWEFFGLK